MKTETGSVGPSNVTARGITVKISVCSAAITRLRSVSPRSGEGGRVLIPGNRSPVDIDEGRIAVVAAELALDTEFDRLVEERDLDLHGQGCATVGLLRVLIGEGQIELDRDVDEPEHAERAAHAQIAGKRRAQVAAWILALQREIDPRHDVHFAARNPDIDRGRCAELERSLKLLEARGIELQMEEAPAAEDRDGEQERVRALRDVEVENRFAVEERQCQCGAEADILECENTDCERRQRDRETRPDASR